MSKTTEVELLICRGRKSAKVQVQVLKKILVKY